MRPIRAPAKATNTGLFEPAMLGLGVTVGVGVTSGVASVGVDSPLVGSGVAEDGLELPLVGFSVGTKVVGTATVSVGTTVVGTATVVSASEWEVRV